MLITIHKIDKTIDVDFDNLPTNVQDYIISYGLTQSLNDAVAGIAKPGERASIHERNVFTDDVIDKVNKRLEAFNAGRVPSGGGGKRLSPVEVEFRKLVEGLFIKALGSKKAALEHIASDHEAALRAAAVAKGKDADEVFAAYWERAETIAAMSKDIEL